jgi:hypothetical protein
MCSLPSGWSLDRTKEEQLPDKSAAFAIRAHRDRAGRCWDWEASIRFATSSVLRLQREALSLLPDHKPVASSPSISGLLNDDN